LLAELGTRPEIGRASGGGARSDLWLRIAASVLRMPLERMEAEEGSAYGAALLGGVAAGVFASVEDAVAECVRPLERIDPDPAWAEVYEAGYRRFRAAYPAIRAID
jgi:xylulokinase